jgi:hypothetical protein
MLDGTPLLCRGIAVFALSKEIRKSGCMVRKEDSFDGEM